MSWRAVNRVLALLFVSAVPSTSLAQQKPYDVFPEAKPPYYRVRYEAGAKPGDLIFPVNYTIWIPPGVKTLRGVVVHQHGCGEGSCKSGLTGAYDLHWQALARKHDCALLGPSYEQPQAADCQMWCDPRNGSAETFKRCLVDLGKASGHPELSEVPWALWGHSGGGHWCGGMVLTHPERVAAAWLRSGVPQLEANPDRPSIKVHELPEAALGVPMMCNPGTKEGVTVKDGRFARVWPANVAFFEKVRGAGGLIGVAVDPLTAHECGNQRYMAIPWLDACLSMRLPMEPGGKIRPMPTDDVWLAKPAGFEAVPASDYEGKALAAAWLPNEAIAKKWMMYVKDTGVTDDTPPPAPTNVRRSGTTIRWDAEADLESGLSHFVLLRDGEAIGTVPEKPTNRFGRPLFQNLQYSDTPTQPLVKMAYDDPAAKRGTDHEYRVVAVNTRGLKSGPSRAAGEEPPEFSWRAEKIDDIEIGYGLQMADVNGDGKTDIVLADKSTFQWYENAGGSGSKPWTKHVIAKNLTERDNVCITARDIDGDGKCEIAVGGQWNYRESNKDGAVFYLIPPEDRTKEWTPVRLFNDPSTHRMHWVKGPKDEYRLVVKPLRGRGTVDGVGPGLRVLEYFMPENPKDEWRTNVVSDVFHMSHNFHPVNWDDDTEEELIVGAKEGVWHHDLVDGEWKLTQLTEDWAGELRDGKLPNGKRFIATIEPKHGNKSAVYVEPAKQRELWPQLSVLDESLKDGHAVVVDDFLGIGSDQVVVGWRTLNDPGIPGIKLFTPLDADGKTWREQVLSSGDIAVEDIKAADLNGDGKVDIVAAARQTKNLVVFWNETRGD